MKSIVYQNKKLIDEKTQKQIENLLDHPCLKDSNIAIMSDAHYGNGIVNIGFSATMENKTIDPNLISNDIGCGITIVSLGDWKPHPKKGKWDCSSFEKIDTIIRGYQIDVQKRFGIGSMAKERIERFRDPNKDDFVYEDLDNAWYLIQVMCEDGFLTPEQGNHAMETFATIGNGNHFIELLKDENDFYYLAVHSGSRALGGLINNNFIEKWKKEIQNQYQTKVNELLKNTPDHQKQSSLAELKKTFQENLKYCEVPLDDYHWSNTLVRAWSHLSRFTMLNLIIRELGLFRLFRDNKNNNIKEVVNVFHNFLDEYGGSYIARKGAVPSYEGQDVAIALNQCEGILIGKGIDNPEMNFTMPHGLGRKFSRKVALETYTLEQHVQAMKEHDVYSSTVNEKTLDEIMFAYKPFALLKEDLFKQLSDVKILKPVYNFKCDN